jgi:hypothetical protein
MPSGEQPEGMMLAGAPNATVGDAERACGAVVEHPVTDARAPAPTSEYTNSVIPFELMMSFP